MPRSPSKTRQRRQRRESPEDIERRIARRRANLPEISYPEALPVSQKKDEILAVIRDHQVVIVAGETGSGKTTQLPKICLELGRGVEGTIGHTQPRRIAARTVSARIAEELGVELGTAIGFSVRFTDKANDDTLVKVMTDGILLAEMQHDRMLRQYDTLIIDEAHERSLNIDFILGYLKQLLPKRPELKVVITSATIDPERFSEHFGDAPIVEVSGRMYPVEVRYRPIVEDVEDADRDQIQAICDAVDELSLEDPGDILVFLSGEREIRDTADALNKRALPRTEVLPLYARLSFADQHKVFERHTGRRIVLATNVAETSLTVPGIKYVIDPGTARISRYSQRLKVQRLPIEAISQASANQRKGRCGRTSDGICVRLYSEEDFLGRPEFTEPEILRTNLASVILQMSALGLGDIARFPFVDPPDRRNVKAGVELLRELGAFGDSDRLTKLGRKLARLPLDPRLARMVLEADENGCVGEVMVIAAALAIQDPRERPEEKQQAADQKHARFTDPDSDFIGYLNLWNYLREKQEELSSSQFRKLCRTEFLNYLRVREWQDVFSQLRQLVKPLGITVNSANTDPQRIHVSLLAGLLSHIGVKDEDSYEYQGARGARFAIFPGSGLFKKAPQWVMAGELVDTSRLWARDVARISPDWIEPLAGHLVKRNYSEPHWSKRQGAVLAYEKVLLYGVPIVEQRRINYGRIDPELSRELFIRHALVRGEWETRHEFFHANRALLDEVEDLEHRVRRRDILVDEETLFEFYDQRVGADVVSAQHFDTWWKGVRREQPDLLTFEKAMLINETANQVSEREYPDTWRQGELSFDLTYQFEPGTDADGVTVHIPLPVLNQIAGTSFGWQIPGLRPALVAELIRSLPKALRRNFVPAPDCADKLLERLRPEGTEQPEPPDTPILEALSRELLRMTGIQVPRDAWQPERIPDHLRMTFRIVDNDRTVAEGKDLDALKRQLEQRTRTVLAEAATGIEWTGLRSWDVGTLPRTVERRRAGHEVKGYPALVDEAGGVAVRVLETEAQQRIAMWKGVRRLLLSSVPSPTRSILGQLRTDEKLALSRAPHGSAPELFDDCFAAAADQLMRAADGMPWTEAEFDRLRDAVRGELSDTALAVVRDVAGILALWHGVEQRLERLGERTRALPGNTRTAGSASEEANAAKRRVGTTNAALRSAVDDIQEQLAGLVYPGFVTDTGIARLVDVRRYLRAIERRLDKVSSDTFRDGERMRTVQALRESYEQLRASLPEDGQHDAELQEIRWMLEELRVSLFAQTLGTPRPVSEKRVRKAMDNLADAFR